MQNQETVKVIFDQNHNQKNYFEFEEIRGEYFVVEERKVHGFKAQNNSSL